MDSLIESGENRSPREKSSVMLIATLALLPLPQDPALEHPVHLDRTGIEWTLPFETARQRAREEGRLLAIKPVAFGTTVTGCW